MLREVDHGWLGSGGLEFHLQRVVLGQGVSHVHLEVAGIAFFTVLAEIGQFQRRQFFSTLQRVLQIRMI